MHRNYRRKYPKNANERYMSPRSWHWTANQPRKDDQRLFWHQDRQLVRRKIHHEEWDDIPPKHGHSVLWNMH